MAYTTRLPKPRVLAPTRRPPPSLQGRRRGPKDDGSRGRGAQGGGAGPQAGRIELAGLARELSPPSYSPPADPGLVRGEPSRVYTRETAFSPERRRAQAGDSAPPRPPRPPGRPRPRSRPALPARPLTMVDASASQVRFVRERYGGSRHRPLTAATTAAAAAAAAAASRGRPGLTGSPDLPFREGASAGRCESQAKARGSKIPAE